MKRTRITAALVLVAIVLSLFSYAIASGTGGDVYCTEPVDCEACEGGTLYAPCTAGCEEGHFACTAEGCVNGQIATTMPCSTCSGTGTTEKTCSRCDGSGKVWIFRCSTCDGTGKISETCTDCTNGSVTTYSDCEACEGGLVDCEACEGGRVATGSCSACTNGIKPCGALVHTVTTPASCTVAGSEITSCESGHVLSSTTLPATGHNYVNGVCTACGEKETVELTQTQKAMMNDTVYLAVYTQSGAYPNEPNYYWARAGTSTAPLWRQTSSRWSMTPTARR